MANRFPIIYNPNANQLQEMASGDNLDLSGNNIINLVGIGVTNIDVVGDVLVTGVSTLGTLQISSGIVTATSGIVTYYGDGYNLENVRPSLTDDTSTNSTFYPVYVDSTSGTPTQTSVSSTKLNFNPSTGNFSATQFTSLSDISKKTKIRPVENALEITKQLEGVRFDWIDNNKPSIGLIAQQVEKVLPELVETSDDGIKSVSYGNIIGVLVEAIKEQQKLIDKLMEK